MNLTEIALKAFTQRYYQTWITQLGHEPESEDLYGIPSPCVVRTQANSVYWAAQPFSQGERLAGVERALEIDLRPEIHAFYTTQFAGDMPAQIGQISLTLLQTWSEDDFKRVQENLIGHLVTQRRLKLSPTLFLATVEDEREVISLCNIEGYIFLEKLGTRQREKLADSLPEFLNQLSVRIESDS